MVELRKHFSRHSYIACRIVLFGEGGNDSHFNCAMACILWLTSAASAVSSGRQTNAPPSNMCASIDERERERISRRALGDDRTSSLRLLQNYRWCLPFPPIPCNHHHHHRGSYPAFSSGLQAEKVLLASRSLFFMKNLQTYNITLYFQTSIVQSSIRPTA